MLQQSLANKTKNQNFVQGNLLYKGLKEKYSFSNIVKSYVNKLQAKRLAEEQGIIITKLLQKHELMKDDALDRNGHPPSSFFTRINVSPSVIRMQMNKINSGNI